MTLVELSVGEGGLGERNQVMQKSRLDEQESFISLEGHIF